MYGDTILGCFTDHIAMLTCDIVPDHLLTLQIHYDSLPEINNRRQGAHWLGIPQHRVIADEVTHHMHSSHSSDIVRVEIPQILLRGISIKKHSTIAIRRNRIIQPIDSSMPPHKDIDRPQSPCVVV